MGNKKLMLLQGCVHISKGIIIMKVLKKLVYSINPDVIICSGWIDKDYLKITKTYFKKIPTIMTCDTHWRGD